MIIVSGKLIIEGGKRREFLDLSRDAMVQARATPGCRDFVVSADPLDEDRVNIYEEWETESQLVQFRGNGSDGALSNLIVDASVTQREVN